MMTLQEILQAAVDGLDCLDHLTTEDYALGGDRPARAALASIVIGLGGSDSPELRREYPEVLG